MTDLRNLTILGLMGRINTLLDAGEAALKPPEVRERIADGTMFSQRCRTVGSAIPPLGRHPGNAETEG